MLTTKGGRKIFDFFLSVSGLVIVHMLHYWLWDTTSNFFNKFSVKAGICNIYSTSVWVFFLAK